MIKRDLLLASAMFCSVAAFADTEMTLFKTDGDVSVRVVNPGTKMTCVNGLITLGKEKFETSKIDSMILEHYVSVSFDGDKVSVSNPFDSVDVKIDGTSVEINSEYVSRRIKYKFSGKSTNGNVIFSSLHKSEFEFNNLELVSAGVNPPVYVITKKNTEVVLVGKNSLKNSDKDTVGATMRGRGQFEFKGNGSLDITSVIGHGIQSSDYVEVKNGNITINAESDGIHVNDYYLQSGGDVNITTKADGVDVGEGYVEITDGNFTVKSGADESRGIRTSIEETKKNNADINIKGGKVDIQLDGEGARGLKAAGAVNVSGGDILVVMGGNTLVDAAGESTVTCGIKADKAMVVDDGNIVVICQSKAGSSRCVQADEMVEINGGMTTLYQNSVDKTVKKPNAVKSDGALVVAKTGYLYVSSDDELTNPYKVSAVVVSGHECDVDTDSRDYDVDEYIMAIPTSPKGYWDAYEKYIK